MPVIEVQGLHKRYGERVAVDDVSFTVERGEIFGILGPNGAGKTTTVECIEGLRKPDGGTVSVFGMDPQRDGPAISQRLGAAARGETVLSPAVASRLVGQMRAPEQEPLSQREIEVLRLVSQGSANKQAAAQLFISEATVKTHLLHVYSKLGVNDRAAAVAAAYQRGLLGA